MSVVRYSGKLVIRTSIMAKPPETHWYRSVVSTRRKLMHRLDPFVRYYTEVQLTAGERRHLAEDSSAAFDLATDFALSFADEYGIDEYVAWWGDERQIGRQPKYAYRPPPLTKKQVRALHSGDEVYWHDPDGACSGFLKIHSIECGPDSVTITTKDGSLTECLYEELS